MSMIQSDVCSVGVRRHAVSLRALNNVGAGLCTQPLHEGETRTEKSQMRIGD
jgi:hypothetical protein